MKNKSPSLSQGLNLLQGREKRNIDLRSDIGVNLTYFPPNINRPSGFIRLFHSSTQIDSAMNGDQIIAVMARTNRNGLESGVFDDKSDRVLGPYKALLGYRYSFIPLRGIWNCA